jgi:hypothetical protein
LLLSNKSGINYQNYHSTSGVYQSSSLRPHPPPRGGTDQGSIYCFDSARDADLPFFPDQRRELLLVVVMRSNALRTLLPLKKSRGAPNKLHTYVVQSSKPIHTDSTPIPPIPNRFHPSHDTGSLSKIQLVNDIQEFRVYSIIILSEQASKMRARRLTERTQILTQVCIPTRKRRPTTNKRQQQAELPTNATQGTIQWTPWHRARVGRRTVGWPVGKTLVA